MSPPAASAVDGICEGGSGIVVGSSALHVAPQPLDAGGHLHRRGDPLGGARLGLHERDQVLHAVAQQVGRPVEQLRPLLGLRPAPRRERGGRRLRRLLRLLHRRLGRLAHDLLGRRVDDPVRAPGTGHPLAADQQPVVSHGPRVEHVLVFGRGRPTRLATGGSQHSDREARASGISMYAVAAALGIAGGSTGPRHRRGCNSRVIVAAIVLFAVEFVVDKVPAVDSTWDAVHTAIRPTAARP